METFVLVFFVLFAVRIALRGVLMTSATYPRATAHSVAEDTFNLVKDVAFLLWAAYLLWGAAL